MRNLEVRINSGIGIDIPDGVTSSWHHCTDTNTIFVLNDSRLFKLIEGQDVELLAE